jgi:hypothetical protein
MLSNQPVLFDRAASELSARYGPIQDRTHGSPWTFSTYYEDEFGPGLQRQFLFFEKRIPPDRLTDVKIETNGLERIFAEDNHGRLCRTVNLDPGYLNLRKVVLATTKDRPHRIYLRDGIFAEVTLAYQNGSFTPFGYTYPDFRQPETIALFNAVRRKQYG